ncbi:MAG TPA: hypothetical protein VD993_04935 [Chitinophagaceae bacterium]|nr:hypothetical protein [Chitinophagaceae bacterium]
MKRLIYPAIAVIAGLAASCKGQKEHSYDSVRLEDFKIDSMAINKDQEYRLLAYSGGNESAKNNIYYHQFIVLNESTNDTLKVLSALICVEGPSGPEGKVYHPVTQFDGTKGVTTATLEKQDSTHNMLLQTLTIGDPESTEAVTKTITSEITANQLVEVNKSMDIFSLPHKTVVGILHFKQMP